MSRFREPPDPVFQRLNASIGFDIRLAPYDVEQSRAHVAMLADSEIISRDDAAALTEGLDRIDQEIAEGTFEPADGDEDVHMAIERRLTELAGPVGGKLHTARSRNDQVATGMALFVRDRAATAQDKLGKLMAALLDAAERHADWPMPGYTHLQRAQPVYLSHHLLAYFWMFRRDVVRFAAAADAAAELPLGAGALAGVNFPTRPPRTGGCARVRARRAQLARRRLQPRLRARLPERRVDLLRCTSRAWARRSCCGRARSSDSSS